MTRYWIYLFRDDVVKDYYHRPEKIVELLREYQKAPFKSVCHKQVEFITERISFSRVELGIKEHFSGQVERNLERNMLMFKHDQTNEEALVIVQKRRLLLISDCYDLTNRIFQSLAMISSAFLAIDSEFSHYQWLKAELENRKFA
ncbi:hypothetical protein GFC29_541 [Anoxybacillus sp. B7M1]|uniref:Sporulation inhibitor of replication protein SirA n=1 Tax=Anoxybacteroides rupiense TaxID=311460 RepID=A0ABD5J0L8_9BACL|nr:MULTISPECIES: sporulation inhibitor of replication protein SirA [Anoxybacillus]ANB56519.1 hypothetical protein GFC28_1086 [Anoxybacillus sp. B2M1]ANB64267.1 hypothetical protein GFC29_541 [Anoxybacillus sp. B7M1]KXG10691.1 hypothetical protein AT864_01282 [Anoxybacillus sp. P3H1B]MBB3906017.1 hypothetical protein [Anoxybacillus rupiensis]MBS2772832.1 sporulation inhibitor of replication protein SirA [Anoxybacillus rupiensis]